MSELFSSPYFGVALSVAAFGIGVKLQQKLKTPVCNPLIVAIVLIVGVLLILKYHMRHIMRAGRSSICSLRLPHRVSRWRSTQK